MNLSFLLRWAPVQMSSGGLRPTLCTLGRVVPSPACPHRREKVRLLGVRTPVRQIRPPLEARDEAREACPEGEEEAAAASVLVVVAAPEHFASQEVEAVYRILNTLTKNHNSTMNNSTFPPICGQSYNHFMLVNYDSRVILTKKLPILRL